MAIYPSGPVRSGPSSWMDGQVEGGARYSIAVQGPPDTQWSAVQGSISDVAATLWARAESIWIFVGSTPHTPRDFGAFVIKPMPQDFFFGNIIVLPQSINLGFILSTVNVTIDIYNAYKVPRTFQNFVNNAGPGVTITDLPSLPTVIQEQDGFTLNLQVSADGPPINGTLDFVFDTITIKVPLVGVRSVFFPFQPEEPIKEKLLFLTDVIRRRDGSEQRFAVRRVPRQVVEMTFELEGRERQYMETLIFSNQALSFGVPLWWWLTFLTSPISVTDTTIFVEQTTFRDFRVGSQAVVWSDAFDFEVLTIDSIAPTSITFVSGFQNAFPAGAYVMPVRIGHLSSQAISSKRPVRLQRTSLVFSVLDSDVDLSDASAFSTFESKVLLDEPNMISGALGERMNRDLLIVDSRSGSFDIFTDQPVSDRRHAKGFFSDSIERLWRVVGLVHALRGRQRSFFIPSFYDDLNPVASISSGGTTIDVENVGYTLFVQSRRPRDVIQVVKTDGTRSTRRVASSSELSDDVERITVDASWGIDATVSEILRVSFVELARIDSDEVVFEHFNQPGLASISAPLASVLE